MRKLNDQERFRHVDYQHTDLRTTFARVRREHQQKKALAKVLPFQQERSKKK